MAPAIEHEVLTGRRLLEAGRVPETAADLRGQRADRADDVRIERPERRCSRETRAQGGGKGKGILVNYTGGDIGASFGKGTLSSRAQQFMSQLRPLFPGVDIPSHSTGRTTLDFWASYPWTKGSYAYWQVGQYTKFSGMEKERQGNCHFCGEHTSQDSQGYLNGAVETGERADEIRRPEARVMAIGAGTASERIAAARERYVARGVATTPLVVARAEGARIWDVDGREYVDFAGGLGCQNTGHGFAAAAIHEQVDRYLHQCFMVGKYEPYVEVRKLLDELWPGETRSLCSTPAPRRSRTRSRSPGSPLNRQDAFDHASPHELTMALTRRRSPQGRLPPALDVPRAGAVSIPRRHADDALEAWPSSSAGRATRARRLIARVCQGEVASFRAGRLSEAPR
jgi:hypothetical protein